MPISTTETPATPSPFNGLSTADRMERLYASDLEEAVATMRLVASSGRPERLSLIFQNKEEAEDFLQVATDKYLAKAATTHCVSADGDGTTDDTPTGINVREITVSYAQTDLSTYILFIAPYQRPLIRTGDHSWL